jgi:hypothetical protein
MARAAGSIALMKSKRGKGAVATWCLDRLNMRQHQVATAPCTALFAIHRTALVLRQPSAKDDG